MLNINERLRKSRENAHLSRKEMAKYCGVSERSIGNYENGEKEIKVEILLKYSQACKESEVYLLTGERPPLIVNEKNKEYSKNSQTFAGEEGASQYRSSEMHGNFIGEPKEIHYHQPLTPELIEKIIEPYKMNLSLLGESLNELKKTLSEKELKIKELRKKLQDNNLTEG